MSETSPELVPLVSPGVQSGDGAVNGIGDAVGDAAGDAGSEGFSVCVHGQDQSEEIVPIDANGDDQPTKKEKKKKKKKNATNDDEIVVTAYGAMSIADRKASKAVADILKTEMATERTFFKWLWTGLHTGAIGSIIFAIFDTDRKDPARLYVIGFSWMVALALVMYGALVFYRRRAALRSGDIEQVPRFTREHSPAIVVIALVSVIGVSMLYAAWKGGVLQRFHLGPAVLGSAAMPPTPRKYMGVPLLR